MLQPEIKYNGIVNSFSETNKNNIEGGFAWYIF